MAIVNLLPFQNEGVYKIHRFGGRALVADQMGLGKTVSSLYWTVRTIESGVVLIVCPAHLKEQWKQEAASHFGLRAQVLTGRKPPRFQKGIQPARYLIINYEILGAWRQYLKKLDVQCIICDECQYLGSSAAARTKAVAQLVRSTRAPHLLCLSGTPFPNHTIEMWPVLRMIRPDKFPSRDKFGWKYTNPKLRPWGMCYLGGKNLPALRKRLLRICMIRRVKADVLDQLPKKKRIVEMLPLSDRAEYLDAKNDYIGWLRRNKKHGAARRAKKALALARMAGLRKLAAELKMPAVIKRIEKMLRSDPGKIIVFGIHKSILRKLHSHFRGISVLINGDISKKHKEGAVRQFRNDPKTRLLIGNLKAAGTGLNLTVADRVVVTELGWNPAIHTQAEDRAHRIGQTKTVRCYYLISADTIEEPLYKLNQQKQELLETAMDGTLTGAFDLRQELLQIERHDTRRKRKRHAFHKRRFVYS